jgi:dolichol-phosphate mannosyltransferase
MAVLDPGSCLANGYGFIIELAWRAHAGGLKMVEVPITFTERRSGASKLGGGIVAEAMWLVTRWGIARRLGRRHRFDSITASCDRCRRSQ